MTFWDKIKNVMTSKRLLSRSEVGSDLWMINRMLSMDTALLPIVAAVNQYLFKLRPDQFYAMLCHAMPRGSKYLNYVKKPKTEPVDKRIQHKISQLLVCSEREIPLLLAVLESAGHTRDAVMAAMGLQKKVRRGKKRRA